MDKNYRTLITLVQIAILSFMQATVCIGQNCIKDTPNMHVTVWRDNKQAPTVVHDCNPFKMHAESKSRATEKTSIPEKFIKSMAQREPFSVEPLLGNIEFGLYAPYNEMCPKIHYGTCNYGEGMRAGTAATPLAQILAYYKYPNQMSGGVIDYYTGSYSIHRVWDCDNTHFNWDNIQDRYGVEEYVGDKTVSTDRIFRYTNLNLPDDNYSGWAEFSFKNTEDSQGYYTLQLWLADANDQLVSPVCEEIHCTLGYGDGISALCKLLVDNKIADGIYKLVVCMNVDAKWYICQSDNGANSKNYFDITKTGDTFISNGNTHRCIPSYSNGQGMEVANLVGAVGAALRIDYRGDGENTQFEQSVYKALVDHFGYDPGIAAYHNRTINKFYVHLVLQEEIAAGRPVYGVYGPNQGFVVDGFRKKDGEILYHICFGNSGMGNGYYPLEDFFIQNSDFGCLVWGIQPASDKPTGVPVSAGDITTLLEIDKDTYKTNQKIIVDIRVFNFTDKIFYEDFVAYALGMDGKKYLLGTSKVDHTLHNRYGSNPKHPIEGIIPSDMPSGEYVVVVYSRQDGIERIVTDKLVAPSFTVEKRDNALSLDNHQLVFTNLSEQHQLTATCTIPGAKLVWSSSNDYSCPVDQNGLVGIRHGGQYFVTVSTDDGEYQDVCRVDHDVLIKEKMLSAYSYDNPESKHLELVCKVGEVVKIYGHNYPSYASDDGCIRTCSDNSVIHIMPLSSADIYCIKEGEATVTYTASDRGGAKATAHIRVSNTIPAVVLQLSKTSLSLYCGHTATLQATVQPWNADVKWSSSNPDIATVDANGKVTGINVGTAIITAESTNGSGVSAQCEVTVVEKPEIGLGQYNYFLLEVNKIQSGKTIQIGEFALLDEDNHEIDGLTCIAGTDSRQNAQEENWNRLTDKTPHTKYCNVEFLDPAYFYFELDHFVNPYGYRIYTANDDKIYPGRHPVSWKLYGSTTYSVDASDSCWELIDIKDNCQDIKPVNLTPFDFIIKEPTELENIFVVSESMPLFIYSSDGKLVKVMRSVDEISQLSKGIYVINGKTFYIK